MAFTAPARARQERLPVFDWLRAAASQLIVLHHMAFYGPLSDYAAPLAPALAGWLSDHARMAVQVFLVIGGFFTARVLNRQEHLRVATVVHLIWTRYRRLSGPYWVALAIAIGANALASRWMQHESISEPPTLGQLLAHLLLLHDLLGYPALSAGIWYLAIDFQLFALCTLVCWGCHALVDILPRAARFSPARAGTLGLAVLALLSLFWFNRHSHYDAFAVYFVGSYFAGFLLHEVLEGRVHVLWGAAYWILVWIAAVVDLRPRLIVAALTALVLFAATRLPLQRAWPKRGIFEYLGKISYSVFLVHFPILLMVNAWGSKRWLSPEAAALGLLLGYCLSILAGSLLYHAVERRTL
ncbi:MAG: acyltransferase family protein [Myxococcales bacterium]